MIRVNLQGVESLRKRLNGIPKKMETAIDVEILHAAREIERGAKKDAPKDQSILVSGITHKKDAPMQYSIYSNALYSAFIEFGTKTRVQVPAGLEEEAARARSVKGASSLSVKEAIFGWCKRKGIEERLWYPIFLSIMVKGIHPHPFFFRQLPIVQPQLIKNIENVLKDL